MSNADQPIPQTVFGYMLARHLPHVLIVLAALAALMGHPAALAYILLLKVAYPVWVGMQLQQWENRGLARRETVQVRFKTELNGIPLSHDGSALSNVFFLSRKALVEKLTQLAMVRVMCDCWIIVFAAHQFWQGIVHGKRILVEAGSAAWWLAGLSVAGFVLYTFSQSIRLLLAARREEWVLSESAGAGTSLVSAFLPVGKSEQTSYRPYLQCLLGQK
ncbi:hypothetical protein [Chitinilyticum aquatile]|uniref:hypothetical protein n=1 Tax=Chitinilyticum aquatile TaxID=362520 RepID=UPI0003FCEF80|nr:hypothetical protein [Chitinilyticum aquatile]